MIVKLLAPGLPRVLGGQVGQTFLVDSLTRTADGELIAHVRDYRYNALGRTCQIWTLGPDCWEEVADITNPANTEQMLAKLLRKGREQAAEEAYRANPVQWNQEYPVANLGEYFGGPIQPGEVERLQAVAADYPVNWKQHALYPTGNREQLAEAIRREIEYGARTHWVAGIVKLDGTKPLWGLVRYVNNVREVHPNIEPTEYVHSLHTLANDINARPKSRNPESPE